MVTIVRILTVFILIVVLSACQQNQTGTLRFVANGEDFIRKGFVSKDGWEISFNHAFVELSNIKGFQTDPPYDPTDGKDISGEAAALKGSYTIDLAEGDETAKPIFIDQVEAPIGHYNAVAWSIVKGTEGALNGNSLVLDGVAVKAGETIAFQISIDTEYTIQAGEFIGEERKGIVEEGQTGELEVTFHFDHLFGDAELPADDELNKEAVGFEPFAQLAENGVADVSLDKLKVENPESYEAVRSIMLSLAHVGEGHAYTKEIK